MCNSLSYRQEKQRTTTSTNFLICPSDLFEHQRSESVRLASATAPHPSVEVSFYHSALENMQEWKEKVKIHLQLKERKHDKTNVPNLGSVLNYFLRDMKSVSNINKSEDMYIHCMHTHKH